MAKAIPVKGGYVFYKSLDNGKYRYYEKYFNEGEGKWKQVSVTLTSKSRQAQAQARQVLHEKIEQACMVLTVNDRLTIADVFPEWLEIRRSELKESTYRTQLYCVSDFMNTFANIRLSKITNLTLQQFLLKNKECHLPYLRLKKTVLSLFFDYCCKVGYIEKNPMNKVVLPKYKKTLEDIRKKKEKFLTKEEMKIYFAYLNRYGQNKVFNALIEVMYLTGLRVGEALGLTSDCVNYQEGTLIVKQTLHHRHRIADYYLSSPKTISGYRTISINNRVITLLKDLENQSELDFYFVNKKGLPYRKENFNYYLKTTFEKSGIVKFSGFKMTSHVLRHSHISLLAELNVPIRLIMDRVGHGDEKTTLNIYTHVTETMQLNLSEKLETIEI